MNKPIPNDVIGYSAYDPFAEWYEYNENECYVADSPESLQRFLVNAMLPAKDYRIDAVKMSDFLEDYGCSSGNYALEPKALERFKRSAKANGIEYEIEEYEDYFADIEPKIFIVRLSKRQRSKGEL